MTAERILAGKGFFSYLLTDKTRNTYLQYSKSKLNEVYLHEKNREMILKTIKGIEL